MDQSTGQLISSAAIGAILVGAVQFFIKRFINRSDSTEELVRKIELRVKVLEENYAKINMNLGALEKQSQIIAKDTAEILTEMRIEEEVKARLKEISNDS